MSKRRTIVDEIMAEYIEWGGPIITRAEAYAWGKRDGVSERALDYCVFARKAVPAPDDPAAHSAFAREIEAMESGRSMPSTPTRTPRSWPRRSRASTSWSND